LNNIEQVRARKGPIVAITTPSGAAKLKGIVNDMIIVPDADDIVMPVVTVIPLQLFAYHLAVALGHDVDKPRNLAKSVTVE
jgi:glucosamine--fructose-6-phosphate aminotransferase (isomerizing)